METTVTTCAHCETDSSRTWERIDGKDYCEHGCWFVCEAHGETLPLTEQADCEHHDICEGCATERYCVECERADHFWDEVDRQYSMSKEGW